MHRERLETEGKFEKNLGQKIYYYYMVHVNQVQGASEQKLIIEQKGLENLLWTYPQKMGRMHRNHSFGSKIKYAIMSRKHR